MKPHKKHNHLTYEQRIKLACWVKDNEPVLKANTDKQSAEKASGALGFTVTDRNIQPVRNALYPDQIPPRGGNPLIAMVDAIHRKVDAAVARVTELERALGVNQPAEGAATQQ